MVEGSVRRVRVRVGRAGYSRRVDFCGVRDVQGNGAGTKNYLRTEDGKCCFGGRCGSGALDMGDRSSSPANAGAQEPRTSSCLIPGPPPSRGNGIGRSCSSKTRALLRQDLTNPPKPHHPGGGRGPVGGVCQLSDACRYCDLSNWTPAFAGVVALDGNGGGWLARPVLSQPSIIVRICVANASIAKGLVIIDIPASRKPEASAAFSA